MFQKLVLLLALVATLGPFLFAEGQEFGGCRMCTRRISYQVTVYRRTTGSRRTCSGGSWFRRRRCSYVTTYSTQSLRQTRYWTQSYCCPDELFPRVPVADGALRLHDGPSPREGRLEVSYKNLHGAVCDDSFGITEAATACHQLGFAGAERVVPCCRYGHRRYGEIWLDDVNCNSRDVWLANCTHRGWGVENCHSGEEVGVKCNAALNIRLANCVNPFEGRVEQYYAGSWGTVCDNRWDMNDAKVVCRQLGLGRPLRATTRAFFGQGRGRTVLSSVDCTGRETALGWCLHSGWNRRSCSHANDAGVVCEGPTPKNLRAVRVTSTAVQLSFELPAQLQYTNAISGADVVYLPRGGTATTVFKTITPSRIARPRFTINRLTPHTRYTFKVCMVGQCTSRGTRLQRGPFSGVISIVTPEDSPGPVASFSGSPVSLTQVLLLWTPPLTPNGVITAYKITSSTSGSATTIATASSATRSYRMRGLHNNTRYTFTVAAVNGAGQGQVTTIVIRTCGGD